MKVELSKISLKLPDIQQKIYVVRAIATPQADCVTMSFCPPSASPNGEAGEALAEESRLHNSLVNQILHGVYPE